MGVRGCLVCVCVRACVRVCDITQGTSKPIRSAKLTTESQSHELVLWDFLPHPTPPFTIPHLHTHPSVPHEYLSDTVAIPHPVVVDGGGGSEGVFGVCVCACVRACV